MDGGSGEYARPVARSWISAYAGMGLRYPAGRYNTCWRIRPFFMPGVLPQPTTRRGFATAMAQPDTAKSRAFPRAFFLCLFLGLAAGAALYAVSDAPLPPFLSRYFYGASSAPQEREALPPQGSVTAAPTPDTPARSPSSSLPFEPAQPSLRPGAEASAPAPVPGPDGQEQAKGDETPETARPGGTPPEETRLQEPGTEGTGRDAADAQKAQESAMTPAPDEPETRDAGAPPPVPQHDAARSPSGSETRVGQSAPEKAGPEVVRYGRAHPVDGQPSVARGRIERSAPVGPAGDDPVVGDAFVRDLAVFLADNYWPRGAHPLARTKGISTAGLRWANMRYGAGLTAFGIERDDPTSGRRRLLEYAFTPGMIRALYRLHAERFCAELEDAARARTTEKGPLNDSQRAELFSIYGDMAKGLAGCIRAYQRTPGVRALVASYADASDKAAEDFMHYAEAMSGPPVAKGKAAERYRLSVLKREQHKENLAAAMRRGGDTKGLDADSLVYAALWLHRRGEGRDAVFSAAAEVYAACSARLHELAKRALQTR